MRSGDRALLATTVLLALTGCFGSEPAPPAPAPEPAVAPKPVARDTGAPPVEDEEARKRREYFERMEAGQPPPAPEPVATAPVPAPAPVAPAPVAPAPKPVAPVAPAPRPVATAPRPSPRPVPLPKPTTVRDAAAPAAVVSAARPTPSPSPTTMTRPAPGEVEPAVADVQPEPGSGTPSGTAEGIPLRPSVDPVGRCGDVPDLEEAASKGALSNADIACLDEAYAQSATPLERERVSVLVLQNAYASGDRLAQEDLLRRHLTEIDGANPEVAYRYALLLQQKGGRAEDVVRWSDTGLLHRSAWTGEVYKQRVTSLYKLRAAAEKAVLDAAESAYAESPGTDTERAVIEAREKTRRFAREWYAFARETGQDAGPAYDLCLIASQSAAFCDGS